MSRLLTISLRMRCQDCKIDFLSKINPKTKGPLSFRILHICQPLSKQIVLRAVGKLCFNQKGRPNIICQNYVGTVFLFTYDCRYKSTRQ